ncbi:MAG: STAS/SEC14 domain-containing protein [Acidimicrobiia bacterium]|nr:STAS/SEC14 domain-containing protein [Acidimicrobiia bacterium]
MLDVLNNEFDGHSGSAMWADTTASVSRWSKWEKIALVTDHQAYGDRVRAFAWMMPGEVKVLTVADLADAMT